MCTTTLINCYTYRHLLEKHCSRNGDLLVCRYGENDVCSFMSDESFNSAEYERHVLKYHTMTIPHSSSRKSSVTSSNSDRYSHEPEWVQYTPAQNLPAVLNDPNKGKQVGMLELFIYNKYSFSFSFFFFLLSTLILF